MNLEDFARQIGSMCARIEDLTRTRDGGEFDAASRWEEATAVLSRSVEEMQVAGEELRRQDQALRESRLAVEAERRRYRELFDFAPDGYLLTDARGLIKEANRAAGALIGRSPAFLEGLPIATLVPVDDRPGFRSGFDRLLEAGRRSGWLVRIQPRDRPASQASVTAEVVRDREGKPAGIRWMIREVTELIQTLWPEALAEPTATGPDGGPAGAGHREQAAYLRDLLDGAGVIVWEVDATTGSYTFISPRAEQLLGYSTDRWLSDHGFWASIIHPDDRDTIRSRRMACQGDSTPSELEYRVFAEDGRTVWFRETVRSVAAGPGQPAVIRGCLWDITRRKKVERQLYTDRRRLSERLSDISYLYSLDGLLLGTIDLVPIVEEVLAAASSLMGADSGAIRLFDRGREWLETVVSLGQSPEYLAVFGRTPVGVGACGLAVERGGPVIIEDVESDGRAAAWAGAARLGGYRSSFSLPLRERDGRIVGALAIFFRDRHRPSPRQVQLVGQYVARASEAIDNARQHLAVRESDRRKEEFLATLAHELRNPITAIRAWAELLEPGPHFEETMFEARQVIGRQAGLMGRLVDDLIDAARMSRGAIALRKECVDAVALAARAAGDLRPLFESRGQQLELSMPDGPVWIEADPSRIVQILINLLTNASRYTDPGGRIDLMASYDPAAGELVLRVSDTGVGLASEALSRIFELFAQAAPARDRARGGLGIGLALVKNLVELHGGDVNASSPGPGRGSEFVVRLPARAQQRADASPPPPESDAAADGSGEMPASTGSDRAPAGTRADAA